MQGTDTIGAERGNDKRPYMLRKSIDAIKDEINIADYTLEHTQLHQNGLGLRGRCPVHGGDNPQSFVVYAEEGRFHCFSCQAGGDVIDLCQALERGYLWEAVVSLSIRYGVELPQRPASWGVRQSEKAEIRERVFREIRETYRRRFYRIFAPLALDDIEDPDERRQEGERIWQRMIGPAHAAARQRMDRRESRA